MKSLYENIFIKWLLIPLFLFLFWIVFALLFNSYTGFSVLAQRGNKYNLIKMPKGKLLKNVMIVGEFKGSENNLGIVSIKFTPPKQVDFDNEDILVFKIKEKGSGRWFYQSKYRSGGIYGVPFFPFGFPVVKDSKGKIFIFSITSLRGNKENGVSMSGQEPVLINKYVFSKKELLTNKNLFIHFLYKKTVNSFTDSEFIISSSIYILPLIFYLFIQFIQMWVSFDKYYFVFIAPLLIVGTIAINIDTVVGIFVGLIGLWIITTFLAHIESSVSFLFSLLFLVFSVLAVILVYQQAVDMFLDWTYMFLLIGALQIGWEENKRREVINYTIFIKRILPKKAALKINNFRTL